MPPCYAVCCKTTAAFYFSDVRISTSRSYTFEWDCCRTSHITSYHLSFPFFYPVYSGFFCVSFSRRFVSFFFFCFFRCYSPLAVIFFPRTFTFALLFARCRWYVCVFFYSFSWWFPPRILIRLCVHRSTTVIISMLWRRCRCRLPRLALAKVFMALHNRKLFSHVFKPSQNMTAK